MTRCLRDYTLFMLYKGDGTEQQWTHLSTCLLCTVRYQQLVRDMEKIGEILEGNPPLRSAAPQSSLFRQYWVPVVAACATMLLLMWGSVHWGPSSRTTLTAKTQPQPENVSEFLQDSVAPALFSLTDINSEVATPVRVSSSAYVQAALEGGWPCERQEPFLTPGCEIHPFPLLIREQSY